MPCAEILSKAGKACEDFMTWPLPCIFGKTSLAKSGPVPKIEISAIIQISKLFFFIAVEF